MSESMGTSENARIVGSHFLGQILTFKFLVSRAEEVLYVVQHRKKARGLVARREILSTEGKLLWGIRTSFRGCRWAKIPSETHTGTVQCDCAPRNLGKLDPFLFLREERRGPNLQGLSSPGLSFLSKTELNPDQLFSMFFLSHLHYTVISMHSAFILRVGHNSTSVSQLFFYQVN